MTDVRGTWELELKGPDDRILKLNLKITGMARQFTGTPASLVNFFSQNSRR